MVQVGAPILVEGPGWQYMSKLSACVEDFEHAPALHKDYPTDPEHIHNFFACVCRDSIYTDAEKAVHSEWVGRSFAKPGFNTDILFLDGRLAWAFPQHPPSYLFHFVMHLEEQEKFWSYETELAALSSDPSAASAQLVLLAAYPEADERV